MLIYVNGVRFTDEAEEMRNIKNVDFFGIVFTNDSEYRVSVGSGRAIADVLHAGGKKVVGVFANQSVDEVKSAVKACHLDAVYLDGFENPDYCRKLGGIIWKSFPMDYDIAEMAYFTQYIEYPFFNVASDGDLSTLAGMGMDFAVAGKINVDNLEAVWAAHPAAVAFGAEFEHNGRKNKGLIEQAVQIMKDFGERGKKA